MAANSDGTPEPESGPDAITRIWRLDDDTSVPGLLRRIGFTYPRPVVVVIGWAAGEISPEVMDSLDLLMVNALVPMCREADAIIVTGGTNVGVMAAVGRAAERVGGCTLVGVAPAAVLIGAGGDPADRNAAPPEPHHTMIATPGIKWRDERPYLVRIAEELSSGRGIAVVAIGGNDGTFDELEMAARREWPILLVETRRDHQGEGASDVVATALAQPLVAERGSPSRARAQATLKESRPSTFAALVEAERGDLLRRMQLTDHLSLARALRWVFSEEELLKDAWRRYAAADSAAACNKGPTHILARWVAALAFVTAVLAGARTAIVQGLLDLQWPTGLVTNVSIGVKVLVTALPLVAVVLLGLMERMSRTRPWIEQRSAAEAILGEIYRFRAGAPIYDLAAPEGVSQESAASRALASTLQAIEMQTSGRTFQGPLTRPPNPVWPPTGACDRVPSPDLLLGTLSGDVYDRARVTNQIDYHDTNSARQDRGAMRTAMLIFGLTAATTLALILSWWRESPLTGIAAFFAAATATGVAWRAYQQRDGITNTSLSTIVLLRRARADWLSLPPRERSEPAKVAGYVTDVEDTIGSERSEWQRAVRKAQDGFLDQARRSGG